MPDPTAKELYERLAIEIAREDELYQKRVNFLVVINLALAAGAASQFHYNIRVALSALVCILALALTITLNSAILDGKSQLLYLRRLYYSSTDMTAWPRPFFHRADADPAQMTVRRYGRIVRELLIAWAAFLLVCLAILGHLVWIGR